MGSGGGSVRGSLGRDYMSVTYGMLYELYECYMSVTCGHGWTDEHLGAVEHCVCGR